MIETVKISEVQVVDRHRKDLGDLAALATSIERLGLLHPIVVTPEYRLLVGERRLRACQHLGWDAIDARVVDTLEDARLALEAERDENTCRKNMTPSELVALGKALEEIERPRAQARQQSGRIKGAAISSGELPGDESRKGSVKEIRTRDEVGKALGVSGGTYYRARRIVDAAEEGDPKAQSALAEMDATGKVWPAYEKYRDDKLGDDLELADIAWVPSPSDSSKKATKQREDLILNYAEQRMTSTQMAELLNLSADGVRKIARRCGIEIHADRVIGKGPRVDSRRIAEQTVLALDNVTAGVELINWEDITRDLAAQWVPILNDAMAEITAFVKQVKENAK